MLNTVYCAGKCHSSYRADDDDGDADIDVAVDACADNADADDRDGRKAAAER